MSDPDGPTWFAIWVMMLLTIGFVASLVFAAWRGWMRWL